MSDLLIDLSSPNKPISTPILQAQRPGVPSAIRSCKMNRDAPRPQTSSSHSLLEEISRLRRANLWERWSAQRWRGALLRERKAKSVGQRACPSSSSDHPAKAAAPRRDLCVNTSSSPKSSISRTPTNQPHLRETIDEPLPGRNADPRSRGGGGGAEPMSLRMRVQHILIQQLKADLATAKETIAAQSDRIKTLLDKMEHEASTKLTPPNEDKSKDLQKSGQPTAKDGEKRAAPPPTVLVRPPMVSQEDIRQLWAAVKRLSNAQTQDREHLRRMGMELQDLWRSLAKVKLGDNQWHPR